MIYNSFVIQHFLYFIDGYLYFVWYPLSQFFTGLQLVVSCFTSRQNINLSSLAQYTHYLPISSLSELNGTCMYSHLKCASSHNDLQQLPYMQIQIMILWRVGLVSASAATRPCRTCHCPWTLCTCEFLGNPHRLAPSQYQQRHRAGKWELESDKRYRR